MTETTQVPVIPGGISVLNVRNVVPNAFNPNVMDDEKYQELVREFREKHFVEPIIVRPSNKDRYEIVDGFHRWKACKEAGLTMIKADVRTMDDDQARVYCYKVNRVRGTIDPIKEAHFFGVEVGKGLTHEQIATKYGLARTTVTQRLSLLTIEEPELKAFQEAINSVDNTKGDERAKVPRGTIKPSVSQLEVLASVPKDVRDGFIQSIRSQVTDNNATPTVNLLQEEAQQVKRIHEAQLEFAKQVDGAKFKVCPKCGGEATEEGYADMIIRCKEFHCWNSETGELTDAWGNKPESKGSNTATLAPPPKKENSVIRLKLSEEDLLKLLGERAKKLVPLFDTINRCEVHGTMDGHEFKVEIGGYSGRAYVEGDPHGDGGGRLQTQVLQLNGLAGKLVQSPGLELL
jgi:ParB/RepB/Spo0J family partition protein